jgi:hypothetical protein
MISFYWQRLLCWVDGHKIGPVMEQWDFYGTPDQGGWRQYHCSACGRVTDVLERHS